MSAGGVVLGLPMDGSAAANVGALARAIAAPLERHGSSPRWRLVVATPHSQDGRVARIREAIGADADFVEVQYRLQPSDTLDVPFHGQSGRARALHAILREAHAHHAKCCVVVDPRLAEPASRLDHLVQPILAGAADFVAPVYSRHPLTGALVHGAVYPIFRALYGARLRYPLGADFGCSHQLIETVLPDPVWQTDSGQRAIDLWLAATAVSGGSRVGQALLGPRLDERSGLDLSTTLTQVMGALFADLERRATVWQRVRGSRALPQFGEAVRAPDPPAVDAADLVDSFRLGARELQDLWSEVLPPLAILQWRRLAATPLDGFRVDDALWARTLYDFAMGHRLRVIARDHLLRSLTPLYLAWLASFAIEVRHAPAEAAEARIERLCLAFEAEKPYLVSQWRWPERFKPVKLRR